MTVTSTVPVLVTAGLLTVIWVSLTMVNLLAGDFPNDTLVAPVKPVPVIVTLVPPVVYPPDGLMLVTAGGGVTYVK